MHQGYRQYRMEGKSRAGILNSFKICMPLRIEKKAVLLCKAASWIFWNCPRWVLALSLIFIQEWNCSVVAGQNPRCSSMILAYKNYLLNYLLMVCFSQKVGTWWTMTSVMILCYMRVHLASKLPSRVLARPAKTISCIGRLTWELK